jgi:hypothetical protein
MRNFALWFRELAGKIWCHARGLKVKIYRIIYNSRVNQIQESIMLSCGIYMTPVTRPVVVSIADCYPKGAGFDSRVMLGIFPLRKRGLRTFVWQTNLGKEANLSRNPEREGPTRVEKRIAKYHEIMTLNNFVIF